MTVYNDDILNEWAERKKAQFIKKHSIPRKINQKSNPTDLLSSEPVVKLTGDEFLPVDGKTFVEQINEYFMSIGNTANSPFGEVRIDLKGIKNDIHHGSGRNKTCSFAAIKPVLENGTIIKPIGYYGTHQKKQASGMIAAPILIGDERYICVVLVVANLQFMRLYVHEVTLTKNLQEVVAQSNPVHSGEESTSRQPQGDISKALIDYINKNRAINTEQPITENKQNKTNIDMKENKQTIKLNESQLRKIVKESVKKILKEGNTLSDFDTIRNSGWQDKMNKIFMLSKEMCEISKNEVPNGFGDRDLYETAFSIYKIAKRWCNSKEPIINEDIDSPFGPWLKPDFEDEETEERLKNDIIDVLAKADTQHFMRYYNNRLKYHDPNVIDAIYQEYSKRRMSGEISY